MIRVKLTLLTEQALLHINPSHQDEPFQSRMTNTVIIPTLYS